MGPTSRSSFDTACLWTGFAGGLVSYQPFGSFEDFGASGAAFGSGLRPWSGGASSGMPWRILLRQRAQREPVSR